jgi:hypothetical protein
MTPGQVLDLSHISPHFKTTILNMRTGVRHVNEARPRQRGSARQQSTGHVNVLSFVNVDRVHVNEAEHVNESVRSSTSSPSLTSDDRSSTRESSLTSDFSHVDVGEHVNVRSTFVHEGELVDERTLTLTCSASLTSAGRPSTKESFVDERLLAR